MRLVKFFCLIFIAVLVPCTALAEGTGPQGWSGTWEISATQADGSRTGGQLKMRIHANGVVRLLRKDTRVKVVKLTWRTLNFQATGLSGGQIPYFSSPGESNGWTDVHLKRDGDTCQGSFKESKTGKIGTYRGRRIEPDKEGRKSIGTVRSFFGKDNIILRNGKSYKIHADSSIFPGDTIKTGTGCKLEIAFKKFSVLLTMGEKTEVSASKFWEKYVKAMEANGVSDEQPESFSLFRLIRGWVTVYTGKIFGPGIRFINTNYSGVGIRGTEFIVNTDPATNTDTWIVLEGKVEVYSKQGQRLVQSQQQLMVKNGGTFGRIEPIDWALVDRLNLGNSFTRQKPPKPPIGPIERGWLGVEVLDISQKHKKILGLKSQQGALVERTFTEGPASKAGIKAGDVIIAINEKKILGSRNLINTVAATPPGTTIEVKNIHGRSIKNIKVKLGIRDIAP